MLGESDSSIFESDGASSHSLCRCDMSSSACARSSRSWSLNPFLIARTPGWPISILVVLVVRSWRVIALDQRGHGWSTAASDYSRVAYRDDVIALLAHLELDSVVLVGHSLGGANAYQLAAYLPDRITALVIEDIGAVIDDDISFATAWPKRFPTFQALKDFLETDDPYFSKVSSSISMGGGFALPPRIWCAHRPS
jgi:pimeloyl-ACP methyl ester carboxylesterase